MNKANLKPLNAGTPLGASPVRRNASTRPKRNRGPKRSSFVTRKEITGGQINVPSNPPQVAYQPWMPLTVVHSGLSGEITIKVSDLASQMKRQIDPTEHLMNATPVFNIRIRSVRAWNLSGRMIALSVNDYSDEGAAKSDTDMLCGLVDTGSTSHVPAVGYELPMSHRNIVLRNGNNGSTDRDDVIYHIVSGSADAVVIYTSVFWKCDGPSKLSLFQDQMLQAIQSIDESTTIMAGRTTKSTSTMGKVYNVTKKILERLPLLDEAAGISDSSSYCLPDQFEEEC